MINNKRMQITPWLRIWIRPKATIRSLIEEGSTRTPLLLAIFWGILVSLNILNYVWITHPGQSIYKNPVFVGMMLLLGILKGIIILYLGSWLYLCTGKWIRGEGKFSDLKCASGWSLYPFSIALMINLIVTGMGNHYGMGLFLQLVHLAVLIWALIIFFKLIGEAHHFSAWKGVITVVMAIILLMIVGIVIVFLIPLLKPLFVTH